MAKCLSFKAFCTLDVYVTGSSWRKWKHLWIFYVLAVARASTNIPLPLTTASSVWICWTCFFSYAWKRKICNSFSLLTMCFFYSLLYCSCIIAHAAFIHLHSFEHNEYSRIQTLTNTHTPTLHSWTQSTFKTIQTEFSIHAIHRQIDKQTFPEWISCSSFE